jgi:diguanylate cyclase (GGDEF)-like protein
MSLFRLETLIATLLVCSACVLAVNELFPQKVEISAGDAWQLTGSDDRYMGGSSVCSWRQTDAGIRLDYDLKDQCASPYAITGLLSQRDKTNDFSWAENIRLTARSSDGRTHFRAQIRNFDGRISQYEDATTWKYNEALFRPGTEFTTIELTQSDFSVPLWWVHRNGVSEADAQTQFSNVHSIEFATMDRTGVGWLEISRIELVGPLIPSATVYPALLALWITSFLAVLIARMAGLARRLREEKNSKARLIKNHRVLSSRLESLAITDPLTNLRNRRGLREPIAAAMKSGPPTSVVMFDIDRFKRLNDTMGHAHGDLVLRDLAELLRLDLRENEIAGRWGGEEFLVVLANTNLARAMERADQLRQLFENSQHRYTCSFGVYEAQVGEDLPTVLERVDQALYDAKNAGRNTVMAFGQARLHVEGPMPVVDAGIFK